MFSTGCVIVEALLRPFRRSRLCNAPWPAAALSLGLALGTVANAQEMSGPALGQPASVPVVGPMSGAALPPHPISLPGDSPAHGITAPGFAAPFAPAASGLMPLTTAPGTGLQPVNFASRDRKAPLDPRIVSMPNQYQKLEVIHHRSQLVIARGPVARFAITDPTVIEIVQYSQTEFSVIGNGLGTTDLMIWFEDQPDPLMYLVTVIRDPSLEDRRRIDYGKIERKLGLLYPNSKVYLIPMSRKIIVRGQARDPEEAARIMQIVRGEVLTQDGALFGGYADAQGDPVGNWAGRNADDNLSSFIVNELQVPGEYQLQIRVRFAELNRAMLREYGINWDSIIQLSGNSVAFGANMGGGDTFSFNGIFDDFSINTLIRALASNGTIKIMEDATLNTMSGQPAAFLSGGEFAVPSTVGLQGAAVGTTTFRGFGTSVIVTPTIIDNDLIRLQITPELSAVNANNSVGGVFGVDVKRVQTLVELREGQTMVLGGLFSRQESVEQTRIPLLGELPILGPMLFHARRATQDEVELLIVVTPEIVRPVDPDQQPPMPGWYVTHPDDVDFYKLNRTEGTADLGHYQLLPYGNGNGYGKNVGYNYYNPAPPGPPLGPAPTGGQQFPGYQGQPIYQGQPVPYGTPGMTDPGYYPQSGYPMQGAPHMVPNGYTPAPAPDANPFVAPPQNEPFHPGGQPMGPQPTPADLSRMSQPRGAIQQTAAQYAVPQHQAPQYQGAQYQATQYQNAQFQAAPQQSPQYSHPQSQYAPQNAQRPNFRR